MDYTTLMMFKVVCESGNMTLAAKKLYVSQPALSQAIKNLEIELNTLLLDRNNRGVKPTKSGNILYNYANDVSIRHQLLINELSAEKEGIHHISVLSTPDIYAYTLPCTLFDLKKNFPNYTFDSTSKASKEIEDLIIKNEGHLGFINGKPLNKDLDYRLAFSTNVYLVAANDYKIAEEVDSDELIKHPILLQTKNKKSRIVLESYLEKLGINTHNLLRPYSLDSTESVKQSVINGIGLAFLPYMVIKKELYLKQLKIVALKNFNFTFDYYIIRNKKYDNNYCSQIVYYLQTSFSKTMC